MFSKFIHRAEQISLRVNRMIARSIGAVILMIIILIIIDVSGRYLLNRPLPGATELTAVFLAYVAFLSYAYGMINKSYVRVEILFQRFPPWLQYLVEILTGIAGVIVFYTLSVGGMNMFLASASVNEQMPASVAFPYWLPKLFVPLGSIIMLVQCLIHTLSNICVLKDGKGEAS